MGAVISENPIKIPLGQDFLVLKEFSQLESVTSGRIEENEDEISGEVQGTSLDQKQTSLK